ncbi:hemolysin family protein [Lacticaseibacillus kribbianus]|uniref:hemolysin family protein n=1 Tax=Lacticaseibacillus kribbianus TaxID=2926292 RepID=UPI001CD3A3E0|nr:hemolysin family protein [Lacticaseibacillus kribbianus]
MDSGPASLWPQLGLIALLTVLNACFAASEIAVVSLSRSRVAAQSKAGDRKAAKLLAILADSTNFLATIQVGITFAGFLSSAQAATTIAARLAPLLPVPGARELSVVLVTILLSYVSLVFGELYPKRLALARTEQVAKAAVGPIGVLSLLMRPFVWLLAASTNLLMRLTPLRVSEDENQVTRDEMVSVTESGKQSGAIDADEYEMLEGIIGLNEKLASSVMVPRIDAFMVSADIPDQAAIDAILANIYSRIPVYRGEKDNVIGVVHIKNLLKEARRVGFANVRLEDVMTKPLFVPETIAVPALLLTMRERQQQMAVLLDEYGGVVGLVTIEDLIEEIVGDIDDESDSATVMVTRLAEGEFLVSGRMTLNDFNDYFDRTLKEPDVDTVAGLVITRLGALPTNAKPERLDLGQGMTLTTGQMAGPRLVDVRVHIAAAPVEDGE